MEIIAKLADEIFGEKIDKKDIVNLISDVEKLYNGECPYYEKCEVGYHTFSHAKDVALATSYMIAGWNKIENDKIDEKLFFIGLAASLFHDSGYIKDKGDKIGKGGKFTFNHEKRSAKIAVDYLRKNNWSEKALSLVSDIILLTDFKVQPKFPEYFSKKEKIVGSMVATADLIAQMSDPNYVESLENLYEEMKEAYEFEGYENLKAKGIKIYESPEELKENIWEFFEEKVIPRLISLNSVYKYLGYYFPAGRNPYGESILANLTNRTNSKFKWEKIGKLLQELGTVKEEDILKAIIKQKEKSSKISLKDYSEEDLIDIIKWIESKSGRNYLGDILIKMGAVENKELRTAIKNQLLPDEILKNIDNNDWPHLLLISMLMGKIRYLPHIFSQSLEIINELLNCECSSILLADKDRSSLTFIVATGPHKDELKDFSIPIDKGVAGWAYNNGKYAIVNEVKTNGRFNEFVDKTIGFQTHSILAVPLLYNEKIIGVIEAVNKRNGNFIERDVSILTIFSHQFSFCIDTIFWILEKIKNYNEN